MTVLWIVYGIILWGANIFFCGWLAEQKNRNATLWVVLGGLLPGLAIIAIAGASKIIHLEGDIVEKKPIKAYWQE